ncbi:MAG: hypothetical protein Q8R92_01895 [Deltaproteobacteria bacterium]|nr:hypothetical protein [Deltaproteobacteria bacterium]
MKERKQLGEILLESGSIDEIKLAKALTDQRRWGNRLGTSLIRLGYIDETTLTRCLARQYGLPGVNLDKVVPQPEALAALPREIARSRLALPLAIARTPDGRTILRVAIGDPQNLECLDEIRFATSYPLQVLIASDHAVLKAIDQHYFGNKQAVRSVRPTDTPAIHGEDAGGEMQIVRGAFEELAETERVRGEGHAAPAEIVDAPEAQEEPEPPRPARASAAGAEALVHLKALVRLLAHKRIISLDELRAELRRR